MQSIEELKLILELIRKYDLPLSPILEYAVNEKIEHIHDVEKEPSFYTSSYNTHESSGLSLNSDIVEDKTIKLTSDLIEAARTPNGGFTKSQLAAIGIEWPPPSNWIEEMIGKMISKSQLERFNHIEYISKPVNFASFKRGGKTYLDVASNAKDRKRMEAVLSAISHFESPATPRDIARTVSLSAWGGSVNEDSVDTILKRLPEVESVQWGKYILKSKKGYSSKSFDL